MSKKVVSMNVVVFLLNVLIVVVVSGGPAWKEVQRGGGLKIGSGGAKNTTSPRGNGIKLGGSTRGMRLTTTTTIPEEDHIYPPTVPTSNSGIAHLHVGMVVPYKSFGVREYTKAVTSAKYSVQRKLKLFKHHDIQVHIDMKELTPSPTDTFYQKMDETRYQKGGDAGSKGTGFQVGLLTMFLLNALQKLKNWRLSTENKRAGKFDDVVLEWPEGAVLLQAKHKKKKKITVEDLLSTNPRSDDFSLPKYFLSYQEIKYDFKGYITLMICSNAGAHENVLEFLCPQQISTDSVLYCANYDRPFYTPNKKILPHLKKGIKEYLEKNYRNKNIDPFVITDENLVYFLDHLQIFANFPSDSDLELIIEQLLTSMKRSNSLYEQIFAIELRSKVTHWFQQKEGIYLNRIRAYAIFSELRMEKYWQKLEKYGVEFQHSGLQLPDSKRIYHMIVQNGYLLQVIKIYQTLRNSKTKILSINPDDNIEVQRQVAQAFQLTQYSYLIIVWLEGTRESVMTEIINKLSAAMTTHQHKKVVLVTESHVELNQLFGLSENDLDISFVSATFNYLSEKTREKILNKDNIVFQGRDTSLKALLVAGDGRDLETAADLSLQRLVPHKKIVVGTPLLELNQSLTRLYINRTFKSENTKIFSEEDIYNVPEKVVLIADTAGMGKTTVLTNLAVVIKEKYPLLWVIKIELNDFSADLKDFLKNKREAINILDLLQSKHTTRLTNDLDKFLFAMEKKVVLMLDGVDEISPDYTDLVRNLLVECQEAPNFAKVFITTRPHVVPKLKEKLKVALFTLESFTEENQIYFLNRYWTNCLNLREHNDKRKCERYAKVLVSKMSLTDLNNRVEDHFAAIPLQLRMLAEIFQESMSSKETFHWEGCQEYIHADEEEPQLPAKMDLVKLYDMFIDKKRDIFMDKENPNGHTAATRALRDQFDECLHLHRHVALNTVLREEERHLFSHYETNEDMETIALKIGILQKFDNEFNFIHRTLAEYFVAQSIVRELQYPKQNPEFEKFLIEQVFYTDTYNTILAFFDNFLQNVLDSIPSTIFQNYQSLNLYKWKIHVDIIHELAEKGCVAVLQLLLKCANFTIIRNKVGSIYDLYEDNDIENHNTLTHLEYMFKRVGLNFKDFSGKTSLHYAVRDSHLKMVKFLVERGAKIDANDDYHSPLVEAAQKGNTDVTKYLLEQALGLETMGVNEASKDKDSDMATFLLEIVPKNSGSNVENTMVPYVAACMGYLDVVKTYMERGIYIDSKFENGETLLFGAVRGEQFSVIDYLTEKGANVDSRDDMGRTALHIIADVYNAVPTATLLINSGIDIDIADNAGCTALHNATSNGNFFMAELLLTNGANITFRDKYGSTALHKAASWGDWYSIELLTINGADVNVIDEQGNTALHVCTERRRQSKIAKFLVEHGADITIKNHRGLTPFHIAVCEKNKDIIKFFVEVGMDVNTTDTRGYTALHLAVEEYLSYFDENSTYEDWETGNECSNLKFLLDQGVNVNMMDNNGRTALYLAVKKDHLHAIRLFIEAGADINHRDKTGRTPLHVAALQYDEGVVKFLIEQGADIKIRDSKGHTPYVLAKKNYNYFVLQYLKDPSSKLSCVLV